MRLGSRRSVSVILRDAKERLRQAQVECAPQEAAWLLSHVTGVHPFALSLQDTELSEEVIEPFVRFVEARRAGAPLQYLLGTTEFCGVRFLVAPGVFIPRPETEGILEAAVQAFSALEGQRGRPLCLLDLGTGSGCLAILLAQRLPTCTVIGVELSWSAVTIARSNVQQHRLSHRVQVIRGDWATALRTTVDGIITNPPYVCREQVNRLPLDVQQEPWMSLDGGVDGSAAIQHILRETPRLLMPDGILVMECAEEHVGRFQDALVSAEWVRDVRPLEDLVQRPRGLLIHRA